MTAGILFLIYSYAQDFPEPVSVYNLIFPAKKSPVPEPEPLPAQPPALPTYSLKNLSWGAYAGWQNSDITDFEQRVGKKIPLVAVFIHWGNENDFPLYLAPIVKDQGKTLVIFWDSMDYNIPSTEQPRFSYDAILAGDWDSYMASFATDAKKYGAPVILVPFEEMNGDWYPWSVTKNNNSAAKHIQAYQYIHKFFANAPNVKFGWSINVNNLPDLASQIKLLYPGDQFVDYVGTDGFNTGDPWQSYSEIFDKTIKGLKTLKKPIYIFAIASAAGANKAAWIRDALTIQIPKHPEIKAWIWFNENKEKDWRVWSDDKSLAAFKAALP